MATIRGWAGIGAVVFSLGMAHAAEPVRVGSKIDTEGSLLGNVILLVLEKHGVKTVNKIQLGATQVVRGAITAGNWISTRNTPVMARPF